MIFFEPVTWPLWLFLPFLRHVVCPFVLGIQTASYFFLVPLHLFLLAWSIYWAPEHTANVHLGSSMLIIMLCYDLYALRWHHNGTQLELTRLRAEKKISTAVLVEE